MVLKPQEEEVGVPDGKTVEFPDRNAMTLAEGGAGEKIPPPKDPKSAP